MVREYEVLVDDTIFYAGIGRSVERPWGLNGGRPGSVNYVDLHANGETQRGARVPATDIDAGTKLTIVTGGGGSYGDPSE